MMESSTPLELMQRYRVEGMCDIGCGVTDETPYGCGGFGARNTPHCTCTSPNQEEE